MSKKKLIEYVQGYYFSKPLREEDLLELQKQKKTPLSTKNLIEKIQNDKIIYNMTEGDDIVEEPHRLGKSGFYRINTTKS